MNYHTLSDFRTDNSEWLKERVVANIATFMDQYIYQILPMHYLSPLSTFWLAGGF